MNHSLAENGHPDVIITDPPRTGMHADVVKAILAARPARIVYVSCNPATQARDIALLSAQLQAGEDPSLWICFLLHIMLRMLPCLNLINPVHKYSLIIIQVFLLIWCE